ncbi:MAG: (2Fe-2S)-binding protein [Steroidobacteraceae bacterium]|jgi:2Fe-2S ferredoxin
MPRITFIQPTGAETTLDVPAGRSLMQVATDASLPGIVAECGGCCSCATCHAFIEGDWFSRLPPPGTTELSMLEGLLEYQPNSRLTCQVVVTTDMDGMRVRLPVAQS